MDDRLSFILRTPGVVEGVVREALRRALAAPRPRGEPPDVRSFSNLALRVLARRTHDPGVPLDPVGRHELEAATLRAAAAFAASSLARRLFRIPVQRIAPGPPGSGADLVVRDVRGRLHLLRLETFRTADDRIAALDAAAKAAPSQLRHERPAIHFFSLLDGTFRSYPSVVTTAPAVKPRMRRVA